MHDRSNRTLRNSRNHRRRRLADSLGGGLARLVVVALFAWWLYAALQGDKVTVAALTVAIVLMDISGK